MIGAGAAEAGQSDRSRNCQAIYIRAFRVGHETALVAPKIPLLSPQMTGEGDYSPLCFFRDISKSYKRITT